MNLLQCSSKFCPYTITSSRYAWAEAIVHCICPRTWFMRRRKVAGVLHKPNGGVKIGTTIRCCQNCFFGVASIHLYLPLTCSQVRSCEKIKNRKINPVYRPNEVGGKHLSWWRCLVYCSQHRTAQIHPSFETRKTGDDQVLADDVSIPCAIMSSTWFQISRSSVIETRLRCWGMGKGSPVWDSVPY